MKKATVPRGNLYLPQDRSGMKKNAKTGQGQMSLFISVIASKVVSCTNYHINYILGATRTLDLDAMLILD